MTPHNHILTWLQQQQITYERIEHDPTDSLQQAVLQCELPPEQVARAVLLGDEHGPLLAVLPLDHVINFAQLFGLADRKLEPLDRLSARYIFTDCEAGSIPPLAAPFHLPALVDQALLEQETVYLEPGSQSLLIKIHGEDFRHLHRASAQGRFSTPAGQLHATSNDFVNQSQYAREHGIRQLRPVEDMQQLIGQIDKLPPVQPLTPRLLQLQRDPNAGVEHLCALIETDPSITAQLLRNARSAYYGFRGEVETLQQAITVVLGFDTALNTALGLSLLRPFDLPRGGPLGLNNLWRHAMHSATLSQHLSRMLPRHLEFKPGLVYLCGLLHNFGFFALGHLFKAEYFLLNRVVAANPGVPTTLIEKRTLGISHTQLGERLMHAWGMPEALIVTVREHHNEAWQGQYALYANLVLLANCLLKPYGIGDAADETPPAVVLNALGLSMEQARAAAQAHMEQAEHLESLIDGMLQSAAA